MKILQVGHYLRIYLSVQMQYISDVTAANAVC